MAKAKTSPKSGTLHQRNTAANAEFAAAHQAEQLEATKAALAATAKRLKAKPTDTRGYEYKP